VIPERALLLALASSALFTAACSGSSESPPGPTPTPTTSPTSTQPASPNAAVRFKGPDRIRNDLGRALSLAPNEICNELGTFSCTDTVHTVTLGGVSPYEHQIYEPLRQTVASTPLAADRVVLAACLERAKRDFAAPEGATVWKGVKVDGAGKLAEASTDTVKAAIDGLYAQLLSRHASDAEIAAIRGFYDKVLAGAPAKPAESWAALSCYAVGTSVEFLFY